MKHVHTRTPKNRVYKTKFHKDRTFPVSRVPLDPAASRRVRWLHALYEYAEGDTRSVPILAARSTAADQDRTREPTAPGAHT